MTTCGLCGEGPSSPGVAFGGTATTVDGTVYLHHNDVHPGKIVGWRDVEDPIVVTCYEAYTTYGRRAGQPPMVPSDRDQEVLEDLRGMLRHMGLLE